MRGIGDPISICSGLTGLYASCTDRDQPPVHALGDRVVLGSDLMGHKRTTSDHTAALRGVCQCSKTLEAQHHRGLLEGHPGESLPPDQAKRALGLHRPHVNVESFSSLQERLAPSAVLHRVSTLHPNNTRQHNRQHKAAL